MQYEVKNVQQNGSISTNEDGTKKMPIMVTAGIVGDTYGFLPPVAGATSFNFPSTGADADAIEQLMLAAAAQYVATTYPNT